MKQVVILLVHAQDAWQCGKPRIHLFVYFVILWQNYMLFHGIVR